MATFPTARSALPESSARKSAGWHHHRERMVDPSSAKDTSKCPRAREVAPICRNATSRQFSAEAVRPTGPAATEHLLQVSLCWENSARASFIHYEEDKIRCLAHLSGSQAPPSRAIMVGAPQLPGILAFANRTLRLAHNFRHNEGRFQDRREYTRNRPCRASPGGCPSEHRESLQHCAAVLQPIFIFHGQLPSWPGKNWQSNELHAHQRGECFLHVFLLVLFSNDTDQTLRKPETLNKLRFRRGAWRTFLVMLFSDRLLLEI